VSKRGGDLAKKVGRDAARENNRPYGQIRLGKRGRGGRGWPRLICWREKNRQGGVHTRSKDEKGSMQGTCQMRLPIEGKESSGGGRKGQAWFDTGIRKIGKTAGPGIVGGKTARRLVRRDSLSA